jgi:hypothetical protein
VPDEAHEWVSFDDPREERTWLFDVTFLASGWTCIYGNGCQGVLTGPTPELAQGCCSYGAHFTDRKDRDHIVRIAKEMPPELWQYAEVGKKKGIFAKAGKDEDGKVEWRTRLVKDACIFLNRLGFPAGPGCALHIYGMQTGQHHSDVKPEVCWQVPLRREDDPQDDGTVISTLTEFGRSGWGEGGDDFYWWCTEDPKPSAFTGAEPVYKSLEVELRKMLGDKLYRQVATYLDARRAAQPAPVVHAAEVPVRFGRTKRATAAGAS